MNFWDIIAAALQSQPQSGPFQNGGFQKFGPSGAPMPGPRVPAPGPSMPMPPVASPFHPSVSTSESFGPASGFVPGGVQPQIHRPPMSRPMGSPAGPMPSGPQAPPQLSMEDVMNALSSAGFPQAPPQAPLSAQALPQLGGPAMNAGSNSQAPQHNRFSALMRAILPGV